MRVLIIDDSKEDRELIINHLKKIKKNDIKIDESNCLEQGLTKLSKQTYDAIILDLVLPESDGIDTVSAILDNLKQQEKTTPVIVITGIEDYSVGRKAWVLGIKDYLIKDEIQTKDLSRALTFATLHSTKKSLTT